VQPVRHVFAGVERLHLTLLSDTNAPVEHYRRVLDLNDAVTRMEYRTWQIRRS